MMSFKSITTIKINLFLVFLFLISFSYVQAEDYPEYIIQDGDYLSYVADLFNTTVNDILAINNIADVNAISIGTRIKIPTLAGISGTINTSTINVGDTLQNIGILSNMPISMIASMNRLTSPTELFIGKTIITVADDKAASISAVETLQNEQTIIEKAALLNINPYLLSKINQTSDLCSFADNQIIFSKINSNNNETNTTIHKISPIVDEIEIHPLPLVQGETHVVHVKSSKVLSLSGKLYDQNLRFFQDTDKPYDWYAMVGINAMADVGLTDFLLTGNDSDGNSFSIDQRVIVQAGQFTTEVVEGVDASTLDESANKEDETAVHSLTQTSSTRTWGDYMSYPVDSPCFASGFGSRRTYNDGSFHNFHDGTDFSVCAADNINIYAAADGTVIFAQEIPVHGNYTVIDHGWGVYTSYSHQSEIKVTVGQQVKRGDIIGLIGSTGRSVGPHLHWEVLINSVYVNALTWINTKFP